jgi:uncharacterized protein (TIGR02147 family)
MTIFDTLDYREYLKAYYEERKEEKKYFSYKVFANAVGMDQSHLAKILVGHMHLPPEKITVFSEYLNLRGTEANYFEALVHFGRAGTPAEAKLWFEKLQVIRPPQFRALSAEQLHYFAFWYTPVVRALVGCLDKGDPREIARHIHPAITEQEVQKALETLIHLDLVEPGENGSMRVREFHVGSGRAPGLVGGELSMLLIRNYHRQVLQIAAKSLDDVPPEDRDISSLTVALDDAAIEDIRTMTREFRKAIQKRIDRVSDASRVYHINIQLVPVTIP